MEAIPYNINLTTSSTLNKQCVEFLILYNVSMVQYSITNMHTMRSVSQINLTFTYRYAVLLIELPKVVIICSTSQPCLMHMFTIYFFKQKAQTYLFLFPVYVSKSCTIQSVFSVESLSYSCP